MAKHFVDTDKTSRLIEQLQGMVWLVQGAWDGYVANSGMDMPQSAITATMWAIEDHIKRLDRAVHGSFTTDASVDNPSYGADLP